MGWIQSIRISGRVFVNVFFNVSYYVKMSRNITFRNVNNIDFTKIPGRNWFEKKKNKNTNYVSRLSAIREGGYCAGTGLVDPDPVYRWFPLYPQIGRRRYIIILLFGLHRGQPDIRPFRLWRSTVPGGWEGCTGWPDESGDIILIQYIIPYPTYCIGILL